MSFKKPEKTESIADAIPHKPVRRYACAAHQCPMPGTMSGEGGNGVCSYHYGTHSTDWPRITQVLLDWQVVTEEITHSRKVLSDPATATHPEVIEEEFRKGVARVEQLTHTWWDQLKPGQTRGGKPDSYDTWANRLECFIGQRVVDVLRVRLGRKAA